MGQDLSGRLLDIGRETAKQKAGFLQPAFSQAQNRSQHLLQFANHLSNVSKE